MLLAASGREAGEASPDQRQRANRQLLRTTSFCYVAAHSQNEEHDCGGQKHATVLVTRNPIEDENDNECNY
jgi:hypothetical protein